MKIKHVILVFMIVLTIALIDQIHLLFQPIEVIPLDQNIILPDYNYYVDHRSLNMNETMDLHLDELYETFGFHDIEYTFNDDVITINKYGEVIPVQSGMTTLTITLLTNTASGRILKKEINYGSIHVIDSDYLNYTVVNNVFTFIDYISRNPSGKFIIGDDIDFTAYNHEFLVSYFSGVLINPYGYEFNHIHLNGASEVAIFKYLDNAYIDGLIIKASSATLTIDPDNLTSPRGAAIIAYRTNNSYLKNIHVEGTVSGSSNLAGIVSLFVNSRLENTAFIGEFITNPNHLNTVGGLVAYSTKSDFKNVYSLLTVTGNVYKLGGLFGEFTESDIESGYVVVQTDNSPIEHYGSFAAINTPILTNNQIKYVYTIQTTLNGYGIAGSHLLSSVEVLKSGETIAGLYDFEFKEGFFPVLSRDIENRP